MAKQDTYRRCKKCGAKTAHWLWKGPGDGICPVCGEGTNYGLSNHGGLGTWEEVEKLKKQLTSK